MTLEEQIAALTASVNEGRAAAEAKFDALQASFDNWKPVVSDLQTQVEALRVRVDRFASYFEGSTSTSPIDETNANRGGRAPSAPGQDGILGAPPSGPVGHRQQPESGGNSLGMNFLTFPPVTGANLLPRSELIQHEQFESRDYRPSHHNWALPKLDFP
jgi:hypothetical protein